jgi:hypothetical protein
VILPCSLGPVLNSLVVDLDERVYGHLPPVEVRVLVCSDVSACRTSSVGVVKRSLLLAAVQWHNEAFRTLPGGGRSDELPTPALAPCVFQVFGSGPPTRLTCRLSIVPHYTRPMFSLSPELQHFLGMPTRTATKPQITLLLLKYFRVRLPPLLRRCAM